MSQANNTLLQMKYARIIMGLSKRLGISSRRALALFMNRIPINIYVRK